jgi:hypothetical protein
MCSGRYLEYGISVRDVRSSNDGWDRKGSI